MDMKIKKVIDNGSGFGPRGKACMEVAIEVPVQTTQHVRLMHQMYSATKKWGAVNDALGGFAAVSYDGNHPILWVRYAPRYQAEDDVLDMNIVSGEVFLEQVQKVYDGIMEFKDSVNKLMVARDIGLNYFSHISANVYHTNTGPIYNLNLELLSNNMKNVPEELMDGGRPVRAASYQAVNVYPGEEDKTNAEVFENYHKRMTEELLNQMYLRKAQEIAMPMLEKKNLRWHDCKYLSHLAKPFTLRVCSDDFYNNVEFADLSGPELLALVKSWTAADFEKMREQLKVKPIEPPTPRAQRSVEEKKHDSDLRKKKKQVEADYLNLVAFVNNRRVQNP